MGTENNNNTSSQDRNSPEYLAQLLKDRKQIQAFPNVFLHLERLLDEEINKVRGNLFHITTSKEPMPLPDAHGPVITLSEKLFVPVKEHPDFNFVGRILGPRGMTAKQLEQDTGCKIMVRGKGSMRDKVKEEMNRGKPNWEHLSEELHVLITVEDSQNRAEAKMRRAIEEVKKLLVPAPEGEDELKKLQLMELAIINGTYRNAQKLPPGVAQHMDILSQNGIPLHFQNDVPRLIGPPLAVSPAFRSPQPAGHPIILSPRMPTMLHQTPTVSVANTLNGGHTPLVSPTDSGLMAAHYDYPYGLAAATLLDYPGALEQTAAGMGYVR